MQSDGTFAPSLNHKIEEQGNTEDLEGKEKQDVYIKQFKVTA